MEKVAHLFSFVKYDGIDSLNPRDNALLQQARKATSLAFAPYSKFHVGAALQLSNGIIVSGGNQENASFPAGLCAERVALATVSSQYPECKIEAIAVSYDNKTGASERPVSPCGICRQSLAEWEQKQHFPIKLVLGGMSGEVYVIESASLLLPLAFTAGDMKKGG